MSNRKHSKDSRSSVQRIDKEFLKEMYAQCNQVYCSFVGFRFQIFVAFISNAALFAFAYEHKSDQLLSYILSVVGIIVFWVMYAIDLHNKYIFKRAINRAQQIERFFNIPLDMGLHSKNPEDEKHVGMHSRIIFLITIGGTMSWIAYIIYILAKCSS